LFVGVNVSLQKRIENYNYVLKDVKRVLIKNTQMAALGGMAVVHNKQAPLEFFAQPEQKPTVLSLKA